MKSKRRLGVRIGILLALSLPFGWIPRDSQALSSFALTEGRPGGPIAIAGTVLSVDDVSSEPTGIGMWQDVIRKSPKKPRGYQNLGDLYTKQKDYVRAATYYEWALQLAQDRPDWERREVELGAGASLGWIYQRLGRYDDSASILVKTWNLYPGNPAVAVNLSYIALLYGNLARQDFIDTHNPQGLTEMVHQAEQAIAVLNAGIATVETGQYRFEFTEDLFWNRGEAERLLGRCSDARESYAASLKLTRGRTMPPCPLT